MTKNKLITILSICLAGLGVITLVFINDAQREPNTHPRKMITTLSWSEQTKLAKQIGIWGSWTSFEPSLNESIAAWQPETGKVIFQVTDDQDSLRYLVAKKRAGRKKSKDGLWEFPGGRVDPRETALQATMRELQEEDPTHALYQSFLESSKNNHKNISFKKLELAKGERLIIFIINIEENHIAPLLQLIQIKNPLSKEIYEYALLPIEQLDLSKKSIRKNWTSKSIDK